MVSYGSTTTYQPVRLAPAVMALITTPNQTTDSCGPFRFDGHFIKASLGIADYPSHVYFSFYRDKQIAEGYGYGYGVSCIDQQTVIATLQIDGYGGHTYVGELAASDCDVARPFTLYWNGYNWFVNGITLDDTPYPLVGGTETNPLLARGEQNAFTGTYVDFTIVTIGFAIPLAEGYGYGYAPAQFQYISGYGGTDVGYGTFPEPNTLYSIQNNDGEIAQSQAYVDSSIVEVEIEIVSKNGVQYVPVSHYDPLTGHFTYYFTAEFNDLYSFRARGFSENRFATTFGNTFQLTVEVDPATIVHTFNQPLLLVPGKGLLLTTKTSTHRFYYQITENCYGTHNVQYSLDSSEWQAVTDHSGSFELSRLTQGLHTLSIRTMSRDGQLSAPDTIEFFTSLSTYVTIDTYPIDPLCGPGRTATISGTREAGAELIDIRGIIPETLRLLTPTTWEADIYILGTEKQVIEITVRNFAGRTETTRQEIFMKVRPPNLYLRPIDSVVFSNKAFVEGQKDAHTSVAISHNGGPWTTVVEANSLTNFQYVIELVTGTNTVDVRLEDTICGFFSDISTLTTSYVDPTVITGGFNINDGDNYTTTPLVVLSFGSTTATTIKVSNFEDFREGFTTPYRETLNWFLLDQPGISRVYVQFLDNSALQSIVYTDDILLTASTQSNMTVTTNHLVVSLDAIDTNTNEPIGTVIKIVNRKNGTYEVLVYETVETAQAGTPLLAAASTTVTGRQTLVLMDAGSGIVVVSGTIEVIIAANAPDVYFDHRTNVFDITTGESTTPISYSITEDADYYYAMAELPYYESQFVGQIKNLVGVTGTTTILDVDKVFVLLQTDIDGYGYGYGYGYGHFAQAICPSPLNERFATYPLDGLRFAYPTLATYARVTKVEEYADYYRLTIDQPITQYDENFGCRLDFTRQNKFYTDYRIRKVDSLVEFINESTYATGNVRITYDYAKKNPGTPDSNWYQLCGLKFNDLISITMPQTENKITFADLNKLRVRFYNGNEGTAPSIVRFIVNSSVVFEDTSSDVIEGVPADGYSYGYSGGTYGLNQGVGDQVVVFEADNTISNETVIQTLTVEFRATTPCMYIGEIEVLGTVPTVDTNCRVTVNGEVVFDHADPCSKNFDRYELRMEKQQVDVWYNGQFVKNVEVPDFDQTNVTRILGVKARTAPDNVSGSFQRFDDKKYYDTPQVPVGLIGRYIAVEANVRRENE